MLKADDISNKFFADEINLLTNSQYFHILTT